MARHLCKTSAATLAKASPSAREEGVNNMYSKLAREEQGPAQKRYRATRTKHGEQQGDYSTSIHKSKKTKQ